ncbi:hypothetical protein [uncultured Paraglaciecola sp.]|uniref:hypothetical protein n=1 Tax=uncultured Paraglaciecola sp. TaxID=1765024 RepID=UPI00261CE4E7|nr:hypothetical protein [uncultured Paraglaciecola sp.]
MQAVRLFTNVDGEAAFEDFELALNVSGAESLISFDASDAIEFAETAVGHDFGWHNAPQKQWVVTLQGAIEVELENGERRVFSASSLLLAENTEGQGHTTKVVGTVPWQCIYIPVAKDSKLFMSN